MQDQHEHDIFSALSATDLDTVTGGGWKSKAAKGAWDLAKWTGIPAAVGGAAAWAKRQVFGPEQPPQQPPQ
jgi:hypothetical protein